jgi:dihydrofolate synthase / folylpolyglutamate synthase
MPELRGFYREWDSRAEGRRRSLRRAALLIRELGLDSGLAPVLAVVGSKGKGTAATYATATLAAAGLETVTVLSPGVRSDRDRLRRQGRAIPLGDLHELSTRLDSARLHLPDTADGYLSPSGLFLIAGALWAKEHGAEALVLEAGMGGRSDEVSLFPAEVVALTGVFPEHLGVLGDSVTDIAREKAAVVAEPTRAFLHPPLASGLEEIVRDTIKERVSGRLAPEVAQPRGSGLPDRVLPVGLPRPSAELGHLAALRLLDTLHHPRPDSARLTAVLSSVRLPGRLSHHTIDGRATRLIVDSAIDRTGIAAATAHAVRTWPRIDHVLICLPDHKDVAGAVAELGGLAVTQMSLPGGRLRFDAALPERWHRAEAEELSPAYLAGLGEHVLVLGTVYFTARVLDTLDTDTETLFDV